LPHIDYYFTPISPHCYLAGLRMEEVAARHGATITYRPVDLNRVYAMTGGTPLPERHESRRAYRLIEIERTAKLNGMPINPQPMFFPANPAPASYAIIAAQTRGGGDVGVLAHALARAVWAEERNIAEDDVICACLEDAGFDRGLAMSGLLEGAETFARNTDAAVAAGAFGAPFYITDDGGRFWGQDRIAMLDMHLGGKL